MSDRPAITITQEDYNRLSSLLEQQAPDNETAEELEYELARATLVPSTEIPDDVVTMNSVVRFANEADHVEHELKLVYPHQTGTEEACVSVLAPAGAALLGLSVGDQIDWPAGPNRTLHLKIIQVKR